MQNLYSSLGTIFRMLQKCSASLKKVLRTSVSLLIKNIVESFSLHLKSDTAAAEF